MHNASTKERIIENALALFSQNGIDATSLEQIAASVGVKAPAIYKHFKSKQEIIDSIIERIFERYDSLVESEKREYEAVGQNLNDFSEETVRLIVAIFRKMIECSVKDEFFFKATKLIQTERYRLEPLKNLYQSEFHEHFLKPAETMLQEFVKKGFLKDEDIVIMSTQFVSPLILGVDSLRSNPGTEDETFSLLEKHITQFFRVYKK